MRHLYHQHKEQNAAAAVDPRVRLMAALLLLALVVSSSSSSFPLQVAGICLPVAVIAGMKARLLMLRLLHPLFIAVVILFLKGFLGSGGQQFEIGSYILTINHSGLLEGLLIVSRIMGAVSVVILLGQLMTFTEIMAALGWLRVPRSLVEVSLFAWRALFMLYDDAGVVYTAQKNRLGYCGIRRALSSFGAMAGMLIIRAFDSSQAMTVAMAQRGYDGQLPLQDNARLGRYQIAGLSVFAFVMAVAWKIQN